MTGYRFFTITALPTTTTQPDKPITITPGSRPLSKFASDPTVSCLHNPYQQKCTSGHIDWHQEREYYAKYAIDTFIWPTVGTERLSCMDFYNQTDGQWLWWPKLRADAIYLPTFSDMVTSHHNPCQNDSQMDFYIYGETGSLPKYVDLHRGLQRQTYRKNDPDNIEICYITSDPVLSTADLDGISHVFTNCLLYYGKILANNDTVAINEKEGK